jgi:PspA associated protein B
VTGFAASSAASVAAVRACCAADAASAAAFFSSAVALEAGGYGDRILCAVFAFRDQAGKAVYWIYNYKRGAFYPFVPAAGEQQRDSEREMRLKAQIGNELPIEADLERWCPLWGIPI